MCTFPLFECRQSARVFSHLRTPVSRHESKTHLSNIVLLPKSLCFEPRGHSYPPFVRSHASKHSIQDQPTCTGGIGRHERHVHQLLCQQELLAAIESRRLALRERSRLSRKVVHHAVERCRRLLRLVPEVGRHGSEPHLFFGIRHGSRDRSSHLPPPRFDPTRPAPTLNCHDATCKRAFLVASSVGWPAVVPEEILRGSDNDVLLFPYHACALRPFHLACRRGSRRVRTAPGTEGRVLFPRSMRSTKIGGGGWVRVPIRASLLSIGDGDRV